MKPDSEASRIGEVVGGKYRIVRLLAKGGMGVVYEAQHAVVRRRFAIKFLRRDLSERRDILTRFQHEAEAAGALENQNVMAAIDFGISDDGAPYIVMEYLVGESLAALFERDGRLPICRAADLIAQAGRGVAAAHEIGIVHRDLKPHNLFVCRREDGTDLLKVLDFGVAKLQAIDEASAATRTGMVLGTAAYMSPEQARGDKTVDSKTDVYALGAILYELVSQRRPHPGDSQNAILHHLSTQPPIPLESVQPDLPPELVDVVKRAIASDPATRPASADALVQALAPFARREVWPVTREESGPTRAEMTSTVLAPGLALPRRPTPMSASSLAPATADDRRPSRPIRRPSPARLLTRVAMVVVTFAAVVVWIRHRAPSAPIDPSPGGRRARTLDPSTSFLGSEPEPGAAQQIAGLIAAKAEDDATLLSAMVATPSAIWVLGGSPEQVQLDVNSALARGARQGRVPVLVAYDHPFRDCTGYGLSGSLDAATYETWLDGFASGIGNEKAVVILEPNSLGLIPFGKRLDGKEDMCKPTLADVNGKRVQAPGATPAERYRQIGYAIDSLAKRAPNAVVYLDGTHSSWLPVGEVAYRLQQAGVDRATGFFLNAGNYQPTNRLIQYGTWVAKCLYYARVSSSNPVATKPFEECASPPDWTDPNDERVWSQVDEWYTKNVDQGAKPPSGSGALAHFVINTNRNGRGPLVASDYAGPPYNQPRSVVEALRAGAWCMPPHRGLGLRPTANTGVPLVDAYVWTDAPGISVASCDIAGGARAWDYSRYNPWRIEGDAQNHFDPLWGRVLPPAGAWFPEEALELARHANPPLEADRPAPADRAAAIPWPGAPAAAESAGTARNAKSARTETTETMSARPLLADQRSRRAAARHIASGPADGEAPAASRKRPERSTAPTFDADNPYR